MVLKEKLSFCEGRFASFAGCGPFTNGPYDMAVPVFANGSWMWRSLCGLANGVWGNRELGKCRIG